MQAPRTPASTAFAFVVALALSVPSASSATDWQALRTINITHQGGEDEAPSNTMYAMERSMRLGADMLEVDVHGTADGHLVVLHDSGVERTTEGSGEVYDMTLAEVQALDSAYNFVPGVGTDSDRPPSHYPFRGVRSGKREPPPGFARRDFRIPRLEELLNAYPGVPINIEIKGQADTNFASFLRNAELLAETLTRAGRSEGIIVASFNDAALEYFHQLMPDVDLAPALVETALFRVVPLPVLPGRVALQVPITVSGLEVTSENWVDDAHRAGYAVHIWLSNDPEDDTVYEKLVAWGVDGIMAAEPAALERFLCANGVPRPPRPDARLGGHCNHTRSSIACNVAPKSAREAKGRGLRVSVRRRDEFEGRCAGKISVRVAGKAAGRGRFVFEGERKGDVARIELGRRAAAAVDEGARRVRLRARPFLGFPRYARVRLAS